MSGRVIILLFAVVSCCVQQVLGFETLSRNEKLELREILKLHKKPVVTTIKTKYGDEYNCVDFYNQPAFDHPNLRNRTFEFKMTPRSTSSQNLVAAKIWENGKGCPSGTVPIRKYTKDHLIRAMRMGKVHAFNLNLTQEAPNNLPSNRYRYSVARKEGSVFGGIAMHASLNNPRVQDSEYSSGQMKIMAGTDSIQTGWTVNPSVNRDHRTRLFIFTTMYTKFCFNDLCPGFVRDDSDFPLDYAFDENTIIGEQSYEWSFSVTLDQTKGRWVLKIGSYENSIMIGFWPKNIFTMGGLGKLVATDVEWGGEVYSESANAENFPDMGSGYHEFIGQSKYTAYCRRIQVQNETGQMVNAPDDIDTYQESPYKISDIEYDSGEPQKFFFYGGPITK